MKALDKAVAAGEVELGPEFKSNGFKAQQADAMVAVARAYLSGGTSEKAGTGADQPRPISTADHYQLAVHVDAKALHGGVGRADLPLETVRRLGCDASLVAVMDDERGQPLALGRKQRTVSPALKRALLARDRGCAFPGCHRHHYIDAHHIRHWADGGETSLDNLVLLCTQHHRLLHEGAFKVWRDDEGELHFERPDGRVIPRGGYRAEDVVDDLVDLGYDDVDAGRIAGFSGGRANGAFGCDDRLNRVVHSTKPSMEVREASGIYLTRSRLDKRQHIPTRQSNSGR